MGQITLRPELVTSSGEACGIMYDDQYVGSLTLLYREEDRLWGNVQLDEEVLDVDEKEEIDMFIHQYIEQMIDALAVPDCLVTVSYSEYDHIISTDDELGEVEEIIEVEAGSIYDEDDVDVVYDVEDFNSEEDDYELYIVGESRNKVEYQLLDRDHDLVAEAELTLKRGDISGDIYWNHEPSEDEVDEVANILVNDFDPDMVDTFYFNMKYKDEVVATFELTHEDLIDEDENIDFGEEDLEDFEPLEATNILDQEDDIYVNVYEDEESDIYFQLIRDDIDTVTFDIYEEESEPGNRLGSVTLNLDGKEITGLVDFINPRDKNVREQIAYQLIEELGDEIQFNTFSLTMQYNDEVIDEIAFDKRDQFDYVGI